uniref:Photolyase/cryptochrome alpha/beta domain-containing protein n=1 Tax=Kalanchoe fedtschenkoi TaxID=63787 RepID=A0A7N0TLJ2_KALFE
MDTNPQTLESSESKSSEEQTQLATIQPKLATASISLSLSTILPSNLVFNPKMSSLLCHQPTKVKIPSQVSTLSYLCISSSVALPPKKPYFKSTISPAPLHVPLSIRPRGPSEPLNAAGARRTTIVWFRNDLRVHDNECLNSANDDSLSVLPVYCFDPRDYGKSSSGFDKTGPYRASFLIQSVSNLRQNLQSRGSDLVIRIGKPEIVLAELAKEVGADAVYAHREVSHAEVKSEEKIEGAMKDEGVEVKYFWGSTLYHLEDLPFKLEEMPTNYGGFKKKVQGLDVRKTIAALDQLKGKPARGDVQPGDVPTLLDLGLTSNSSVGQDGKSAVCSTMIGGETEALQRLQKFATEFQSQPSQGTGDSIYGANFSCKISPWLAMGCLSPRSMFDELKKTASRTMPAAPDKKNSDTSMDWLMYELMWRDFFRFITKKYSSATKPSAAPATACTGALA